MTDNWKQQAEEMAQKGKSWRKIAKELGVSKSTCSDYLRKVFKQDVASTIPDEEEAIPIEIITHSSVKHGKKYIVIPDTQCKPGISLEYLRWVGEYIAEKKPDVIVHLGDHADMESLSSYDKGKKSAEGKRVANDIEVAIAGMNVLLAPIKREQSLSGYSPQMVFTLGNHEQRLSRHVEANPELEGFLGYESLKYEEMGWEVYDYLQPAILDGICFIHYYPNPFTGKPYGGSAANMLQKIGTSFVQGHRQTLDVATRTLHNGEHQWGIIAGSCYVHSEGYKGYTGNKHWRGIITLHNVHNGGFDPLFVGLDYLERRYAIPTAN